MAKERDVSSKLAVCSLPLSAPSSLRELLCHWKSIFENRLPSETDFPIDELVHSHPGFGIIEPAMSPEGRPDYRYVRMGPEHLERTKTDLEGRLFSDVLNIDALPRAMKVYDELFASGRPHYWERMNMVDGSPPTKYKRLLLPLFDRNEHVTSTLGSWIWEGDDALPQS